MGLNFKTNMAGTLYIF